MALWTQSDIDSLKAAVASGVLSVTYSGPPQRTVTYHSLSEMRALLTEMVADVNAQAGGSSFSIASTKKGFDE